MEKRLVIGIGTGRCGTKTLAALLNMQEGAMVSHEMFGSNLTWKPDPIFIEAVEWKFAEGSNRLFGDVALNWLPYVMMFSSKELRPIVLQRDRRSTVKSLLNRAGDRDWWRRGVTEDADWFKAMPTYNDTMTKREAVERYYDEYYAECMELQDIFGDRLLWVRTEDLSSEAEQRRILAHVGYEPDEMRIDTRLNIRTKGEFKEVVG